MIDLQVHNVTVPSIIDFFRFEKELENRGFERLCKSTDVLVGINQVSHWAISLKRKSFVRCTELLPSDLTITSIQFLHEHRGIFIGEDLNIV